VWYVIAKRIPARQHTSSIARLARYVVNARGGLDPRSWERTADYILDQNAEKNAQGEKVGGLRVTNCGTDDPAAATLLIEAVQAANTRSKNDKTYHLVFAFPPGEQPPLETLHAIEDELCAAIGFADHQRISAVHIDTDHLHVHVAINKVHPTGHQNIEPFYDKQRLMEACDRLEIKHGLQRTNHGLEDIQRERGNRSRIELGPEQRGEEPAGSVRRAGNGDRADAGRRRRLIGDRAAAVEAQSGMETLARYVAREVSPALRAATSWRAVHAELAGHGLQIKERGAGLVIGDDGIPLWVRASQCARELSMKAMTDRLGPFVQADGQHRGDAASRYRQRSYTPKPMQQHPATTQLFAQYQRERQARLAQRKAGGAALRVERADYMVQMRRWNATQRALLKATSKGAVRKIMSTTIQEQSRAAIAKQRQMMTQRRTALAQATTMPSWNDWLAQQAERGNVDALAVLRSRAEKEEKLRGDLLTAERAERARTVIMESMKPTARRDGAMTYRTADGGMVIDRKTHVQAQKATAGAALVALSLSAERFEGQALIVEGTEQFKADVARLAGLHQIKVTFKDAGLEALRQAAERERASSKKPAVKTVELAPREWGDGSANAKAGARDSVTAWIEKRNADKDKISSIDYHRRWQNTDAGAATYQGRRRMEDGKEVVLLKRGDTMLVKDASPAVAAKASKWKLGRTVQVDARGRFIDNSRATEL